MALLKVQFTPGIKKEGTALTAKGGWFDANLVRFPTNDYFTTLRTKMGWSGKFR